ncbi:MAG: hypothetical protein ACYC1M_18300 [Armatimonadota bacterium]
MKSLSDKVLVTAFVFWLLLFVLPVPSLTGIRSRLYSMMFEGGVTDFVVTPSGDRFRVEANGIIYAACPQTYNYSLSQDKVNDDDARLYKSSWYQGRYVMNATSFRVVKDGIVGQTETGYYIINTAKRLVYINLGLPEWQRMLAQMRVPTDIQCHPLPLRVDYASRGWLRYQPE